MNILQKADSIASEQRESIYGSPLVNHQRIANLWNIQLADKLKQPITPADVCLLMISLKLARLIQSPTHYDSALDIAGYVKCWEQCQEPTP